MEDFNILDSLNRIKEQIYIDFNTINSLNNYLDSLKLSNQNKDYSKTISLMNEDSQRKLEEYQKENQLLQNRIQKLEELIQSNKMEYQNILNNNENYLKIIEQQKVTINNLKDQLNIKENCAKILNENNNFILNNFNL
jgi:chromosome segregation ATPase